VRTPLKNLVHNLPDYEERMNTGSNSPGQNVPLSLYPQPDEFGPRFRRIVLTDDARLSAESPLTDLDEVIGQLRARASEASCRNDLAVALQARHAVTGDADALEEAARLARTLPGIENAAYRVNLGAILCACYAQAEDRQLLEEAAAQLREAVSAGHPGALQNLSLVLLYQGGADPEVLEQALDCARRALAAGERRPDCLANMLLILGRRYDTDNADETLGEIFAAAREMADSVPQDSRARELYALASFLRDISERQGNAAIAAETVEVMRRCVASTAPAGDERPVMLFRLALDLDTLFKEAADRAVLDEAVSMHRDALDAFPDEHPLRAFCLSALGAHLLQVFYVTGEVASLREAVPFLRSAVADLPETGPEQDLRHTLLTGLRTGLAMLYEFTGEQEFLGEFAEVGQAVAGAPADDESVVRFAATLQGSLWRSEFERSGDPELLRRAVGALRLQLKGLPAGDPFGAIIQAEFMNVLEQEYEFTSDISLLHEAVSVGRQFAAAPPPDDPEDLSVVLNSLVVALVKLYEMTGDVALLREAVTHGETSVAAASSALLLMSSTAQLAMASMILGTRTGDPQALREAIRLGHAAVDGIPHGHPSRALALLNLGSAARSLYVLTGDLPTLREGVAAVQASAAALPAGSPQRGLVLDNLGAALYLLAARTGDQRFLDEAVTAARGALIAVPASHHLRWTGLHHLAAALQDKYDRTGNAETGRELIMVRRAAVTAAGDNHQYRGALAGQLCNSLHAVFRRTGNLRSLREAVAAGRAAVSAVPSDHLERGSHLRFLGNALLSMYETAGDPEALAGARECYAEAVESAISTITQVHAARGLARAQVAAGDPAAGLAAIEDAVGRLPRIASRALSRPDRELRLGDISGIANQAAATALLAGLPGRAMELLEETRGRLLAEAMGSRGAMSRVSGYSAELGAQLERIEGEFAAIEAAAATASDPAVPGSARPGDGAQEAGQIARARAVADRRERADAQYTDLLQRIRDHPQLADFLRTPAVAEMQRQAGSLPIVTVVTDPSHCGALILTGDLAEPVLHVPLPDLTSDEVTVQVDRFRGARHSAQDQHTPLGTQRNAQQTMLAILGWLWDTVAAPVLTALGHTTTPDPETGQGWPRVWWCPTGFLSYLPLHAAGHHGDVADGTRHPRTVLDRVVSSYTATVRSLGYAAALTPPPAPPGAPLIVAASGVPGVARLDEATAEAEQIARLCPGATVLDGPAATREAVLAALRTHSVAHFACHGVSDWSVPQDSRLLLYDHADSPLSIADISALPLNADLAYLSACETAETPVRLADEIIHITSSFQLAGFRHVVGTLWPVNDQAARQIATAVYGRLSAQGTRPVDSAGTAWALHEATRQLRETCVLAPTRWAAHVHVGP
jgi:hypothetical protein